MLIIFSEFETQPFVTFISIITNLSKSSRLRLFNGNIVWFARSVVFNCNDKSMSVFPSIE